MSIPAPDEISIEDPLCNSSLGAWSLWTMSHPSHILDWRMKPRKTHGGVADTLNLHLPQVMAMERELEKGSICSSDDSDTDWWTDEQCAP